MAAVTASFLLGRRGTGSGQQQRSTARRIIDLPFGRALLAAVGLVVLAMCSWQLFEASRGDVGRGLVVLAAAGFAVFAAYSLLEARYRQVGAGA